MSEDRFFPLSAFYPIFHDVGGELMVFVGAVQVPDVHPRVRAGCCSYWVV